ncbi:MAG TPA: RHS repeat domain-containing protein, partial [Gallionella sp.]
MIVAAKQRNKHRMHEPHLACLRAQIAPRNDDGLRGVYPEQSRWASPILRLSEYDPNNNPTKSTDAKGQITQYTYGYGGQLLSRTDHNGKKTAYTYNALGQVLTAQNPEVTYSHTYDSPRR